MKKVTLLDIAEKVGVSSVTVHNALAGNRGVGDELRSKIQQTANSLGYAPKNSTINKTKNDIYSTINIGIIIAERYMENPLSYYAMVYQETAIVATRVNCSTMLEVLSDTNENNMIFPEIIKQNKVDGLLLLGAINGEYVKQLSAAANIPVVCFDFYDKDLGGDAVIADNFYGMYHMTNYLLDKGHTNIAFVGTISANSSIMDRYLGFCKAFLERGLDINKEWVLDDRGADGRMFDITLPEKMPTAFACNCDLVAGRLIKQLQDLGYSIPNDISIVGFDNFILDGLCDIAITTYEIDVKKMAEIALRKAINCIHKNELDFNRMEIVTGHVVEKNSVKGRN